MNPNPDVALQAEYCKQQNFGENFHNFCGFLCSWYLQYSNSTKFFVAKNFHNFCACKKFLSVSRGEWYTGI